MGRFDEGSREVHRALKCFPSDQRKCGIRLMVYSTRTTVKVVFQIVETKCREFLELFIVQVESSFSCCWSQD